MSAWHMFCLGSAEARGCLFDVCFASAPYAAQGVQDALYAKAAPWVERPQSASACAWPTRVHRACACASTARAAADSTRIRQGARGVAQPRNRDGALALKQVSVVFFLRMLGSLLRASHARVDRSHRLRPHLSPCVAHACRAAGRGGRSSPGRGIGASSASLSKATGRSEPGSEPPVGTEYRSEARKKRMAPQSGEGRRGPSCPSSASRRSAGAERDRRGVRVFTEATPYLGFGGDVRQPISRRDKVQLRPSTGSRGHCVGGPTEQQGGRAGLARVPGSVSHRKALPGSRCSRLGAAMSAGHTFRLGRRLCR